MEPVVSYDSADEEESMSIGGLESQTDQDDKSDYDLGIDLSTEQQEYVWFTIIIL